MGAVLWIWRHFFVSWRILHGISKDLLISNIMMENVEYLLNDDIYVVAQAG